jgi:hypothetical protein
VDHPPQNRPHRRSVAARSVGGLVRDDVSALDEDLLVIAEEFGNWEDARRRIDLLAVDKGGRWS